jgi:hypothetical protein
VSRGAGQRDSTGIPSRAQLEISWTPRDGPSLALLPRMMMLGRHALRGSELRAMRLRRLGRCGLWVGYLLWVAAIISLVIHSWAEALTCRGSPRDLTRLVLRKYAYDAYPAWRLDHPDQVCPRSLGDLAEYMNTDNRRDAWGSPIELRCGPSAPAGVPGIWVRSAGEDQMFDTADDVDSS